MKKQKKVVIIGGGFAGLSALRYLRRNLVNCQLILLDKKKTTDFLPLLPDVLSNRVNVDYLSYPLSRIADSNHVEFITRDVQDINLKKKFITTNVEDISYDFLLIACGTRTNYYGNNDIEKSSYCLDSVHDIVRLKKAAEDFKGEEIIIAGGGYTGIEIATNLRKRFPQKKIYIIEAAAEILGLLPPLMKKYAYHNVKRSDIDICSETMITGIDAAGITLSSGRKFNHPLLIWTAGVKTPECVQRLPVSKNKQGRLEIDGFLRINDYCFVAGDCAAVMYKGNPLRMSVQNAIMQGKIGAYNICASLNQRPLKRFKPLDLGYVIPMANNLSCGIVLGHFITGRMPTFLHYFMSIYRLSGISNRIRLFAFIFARVRLFLKP